MAEKIANFDDWKDLFYKWQKDIGFDASLVKDYKFDAIYDDGTGPDIEFGETNELGRVNKVDPLGITDLRIRGMWAIKHPGRVFDYLPETIIDADFKVNALMLTSKYDSFPKADRGKSRKISF